MNEDAFKDKKWNEYPFSFPPVNTLALVEYDTARQEWYKGFVLALGDDADGEFCQFQWLEGPKTNQTSYYYTPESFRPLLPVQNKESKSDQMDFLTKAYEEVWKMNIPAYLIHMLMNQVQPDNKEQKDSPKEEKSIDNLLKELHNLKQEQKAISNKIDNILNEINSVVGLYGLSLLFTNEYDVLQEND